MPGISCRGYAAHVYRKLTLYLSVLVVLRLSPDQNLHSVQTQGGKDAEKRALALINNLKSTGQAKAFGAGMQACEATHMTCCHPF